jgi:hypothetical protein
MPPKTPTTNTAPQATPSPAAVLEAARTALAKTEVDAASVAARLADARTKRDAAVTDAAAYALAAEAMRALEVEGQRLAGLAALQRSKLANAQRAADTAQLAELETAAREQLAAVKVAGEEMARRVAALYQAKATLDDAMAAATLTFDRVSTLARKLEVDSAVLHDVHTSRLPSYAFAHHAALLGDLAGEAGQLVAPVWLARQTPVQVLEALREAHGLPRPSPELANTWPVPEQVRCIREQGPAAYTATVRAGVRPPPPPLDPADDPALSLGMRFAAKAQRLADRAFSTFND